MTATRHRSGNKTKLMIIKIFMSRYLQSVERELYGKLHVRSRTTEEHTTVLDESGHGCGRFNIESS